MMPATGMAVAQAQAERSASSRSECSDCSHCANPSRLRNRTGVRVSVNLGQFFSDQRARAYMWAPHGRCVQWLGRRVARVFGLPDDIALMSRGHMLPVKEPLLMLDRDDPIEVVNMSYVLTSHDEKNYSNEPKGGAKTAVHQGQSNVIIKQQNEGQLNQAENLAENQNRSRLSPTRNVESVIGSEQTDSLGLDDSEDLQRMKRRALRLLDEHCWTENILDEASSQKRVRRRRRRRRPSASHNQFNVKLLPTDSDGVVLHNSVGFRPPRLVRALSPIPIT